jgi:hypothetical protein
MRNIVNEDGEIIAKATKDGTLVGGHHRIIAAGSLGQKLFWQDTDEPVKLDALMHLSSSTTWRRRIGIISAIASAN